MTIDPTAILQTLVLSGIGWLIALATSISKKVTQLNDRLAELDAWREQHDRSDDRRFGALEQDMQRLRWLRGTARPPGQNGD